MNYDVHRKICTGTIEVASWTSNRAQQTLRDTIFGPFQLLGKFYSMSPQPTWRMVPYHLHIDTEDPWSYAKPKSMFIVFQ